MKESVTICLKKFGVFRGRATRSEYWFFVLAFFLFAIVGNIIVGLIGSSFITAIFGLGFLSLYIPLWAVAVRRMHDVGKSGWYLFIPVYSLILGCTESSGANEYGPKFN